MMTRTDLRSLSNALVLTVAGVGAVAAANTYVYDNVGGWAIRTDLDRNFDCFAEAIYDDGTTIRVGHDSASGTKFFDFADPSWAPIPSTERGRLAIAFDEMEIEWYEAEAAIVDGEEALMGLRLRLSKEEEQRFFERFARHRTLSIGLAGGDRQAVLSLSGSMRATELLDACQAEFLSEKTASIR